MGRRLVTGISIKVTVIHTITTSLHPVTAPQSASVSCVKNTISDFIFVLPSSKDNLPTPPPESFAAREGNWPYINDEVHEGRD